MSQYNPSRAREEQVWSIWQGLELPSSDLDVSSASTNRTRHVPGAMDVNETERVRQALTPPNPVQARCRVPGCRIRNCNLGTHRSYVPRSTNRRFPRQEATTGMNEMLRQIEAFDVSIPLATGVDGFPKLPLEETLDLKFRSLFHFFFTSTFDKLAVLFRGPSVSDMHVFKERMLAAALTSEAYCRSLILQARTEQDLAVSAFDESEEALNMSSSTLKAFREHVARIRQRPHPAEIELALLALCCLMMYDFAHEKGNALRVHWQGMRDLVAMRGGMHCVTMALSYVVHADRMCAVQFGEMPTYTKSLPHALPGPIQSPGSLRYGSKFHAMRDHSVTLDPAVIDYLVDVSGLVELWEEQRLQTVSRRNRRPVSSLEYLHFARDRLDERFATLNAQWAQVDSTERCLLWASRIVEYPCTWANYVETTTRQHCRKLTVALESRPSLADKWQSGVEVLTWMLFVLTTSKCSREVYTWAFRRLSGMLNNKYGVTPWPQMWWADEQENLLKFVWSSSFYADQFRKICDELEGQSRHVAVVAYRPGSRQARHNT